MSSAGGSPSWQAMVSVGTSIVPPGPCPPPEDSPGASPAATTPQVTASVHDFAVSLALRPCRPDVHVMPKRAGLFMPKRAGLFVSKRPVHDMEANVSVRRVTKRLRHRGKDLKAEGAPQPNRRLIGFDDRIELHRPVAVRACLIKDMAAQGAAYALAAPCRMDDKAGIGNVCPRPRVDGMSVCAPDDASIVIHGNKSASRRLSHPPSACPRFGSCRIPRQGLPGGTLPFQDQPDSWPVLCLRLTYHHVASIARPARFCAALRARGTARSLWRG
jgi:hypothetical protein